MSLNGSVGPQQEDQEMDAIGDSGPAVVDVADVSVDAAHLAPTEHSMFISNITDRACAVIVYQFITGGITPISKQMVSIGGEGSSVKKFLKLFEKTDYTDPNVKVWRSNAPITLIGLDDPEAFSAGTRFNWTKKDVLETMEPEKKNLVENWAAVVAKNFFYIRHDTRGGTKWKWVTNLLTTVPIYNRKEKEAVQAALVKYFSTETLLNKTDFSVLTKSKGFKIADGYDHDQLQALAAAGATEDVDIWIMEVQATPDMAMDLAAFLPRGDFFEIPEYPQGLFKACFLKFDARTAEPGTEAQGVHCSRYAQPPRNQDHQR
jgi:hypothetical protein